MAAVKQHSRKGRKKHRRSIFCFLGGCFGISNKVSADHGDRKLVKHVSNNPSRGKTVPVNDLTLPRSSEIISSSKEIHVVEAEEKSRLILAPPAHEVVNNKTHDMILEKRKSLDQSGRVTSSIKRIDKQNSTAQETWSNPTKLSHSVSLPLPRQKKEKPSAGGGKKSEKGKKLIIAGEFDSMVGALIILVTLIVMLIWGKVCAILCTAAWFYFIPRFRANIDESYAMKLKNGTDHIDLDSWEYKKKVVLQGLLDRNQHV
ncbi:hypothetical protein Pfo_024551 [Paulownia fortunei]|nr:hypothetical protein Pfo_024551 [Paulownia fortunei]